MFLDDADVDLKASAGLLKTEKTPIEKLHV